MAGIKVISPPAVEPITVSDLKPQLGYDLTDTSPDERLLPLIPAAREWAEDYTKRVFITQTLEFALDEWPCQEWTDNRGKSHASIELPRLPLQSVTSVTYTDKDGVTAVWVASNYVVDDFSFVPRIVRKRGIAWPSVQLAAANGVRVRFVAGYGDTAASVPQKIKQALIMLVAYWYENGMCDPPCAVTSLLDMDRWVNV
ncbi:hypothetical protein P4H70_23025 [Paenibacillus ehimensis]|uniref:head-tail connector protein n=1 Tax=Paenibacillus ehimensis TaxID=79264 RepID=UPI002DB5CC8E|nr:hypothetical protein [Paenibacillus ehimensis]MEC0211818.1 hypothetical protein [Paenibacillus ehimensis]